MHQRSIAVIALRIDAAYHPGEALALAVQQELERQLTAKHPNTKCSFFTYIVDTQEIADDPANSPAFRTWAESVDAVVGGAEAVSAEKGYNADTLPSPRMVKTAEELGEITDGTWTATRRTGEAVTLTSPGGATSVLCDGGSKKQEPQERGKVCIP